MKEVTEYDVGVIVARFQNASLHEAHTKLIDHVMSQHKKVIIVLGLAPVPGTRNNPLDFEARKQMILERYPKVNVLYIKDVNSDDVWSKRLDELVHDLLTPSQTAVLYGSRDSFIPHYNGKLPTRELQQEVFISATEQRKDIASRSVKATQEFREGVIWATSNRYPTVYHTVDVFILNPDETKVLLGRKPNEAKYRLVGGFTDVNCDSDEQDAVREAEEETGLKLTDVEYVGSTNIDDWRYRSEVDKIRTKLYIGYTDGKQNPVAGDDIAEVRWFSRQDLDNRVFQEENLMPEHRRLVRMALHHLWRNDE